MRRNDMDEMIKYTIGEFTNYFGDRVSEFSVENDVGAIPQESSFAITFKAYDYFPIQFRYDKGNFGCCILTGEKIVIELEMAQKRWDGTNFNLFLKELKEELELRIPDKYLLAHGWL